MLTQPCMTMTTHFSCSESRSRECLGLVYVCSTGGFGLFHIVLPLGDRIVNFCGRFCLKVASSL